MAEAIVVYASLTGNTEKIAEILTKELEKLGVKVLLEECTQVDAEDFLNFDISVVATYTYGVAGDLPDEIYDLFYDLEEVDLSGKIYGSLGSGEELYDYYCKSADDFDEQFAKTGAVKGAEVLKIEAFPDEEDAVKIAAFAKSLVDKYEELKA